MKALVTTVGGLEVADVPDPKPGAGQVVVAVHSCGICGSDVHSVELGAGQPGRILGHEFSGTVAELGAGVGRWRVGQPVAVNPLGSCGACEWCAKGLFILCRAAPNLGLNAPGGFAEYVVADQKQLFAVPEGMPLEHGSRVEPLAVALRAVVEARPAPGDNALVFGVGPIGLNVILALRAAEAGTIVAVGRSPGRRAAAAAAGADVVLDSRETDVVRYCRDAGLEIAHAYECAGDPAALQVCAECLKLGGTVVGVSLGQTATISPRLFVTRNLRFVSATAFGDAEYGRALGLISSGAADVRPLISERVPLSAAPDAFVRLRHPGDLVSVLVQPQVGG
jgi:threonine dehydrogenase-like Zn-dependent dehydrogenase